MVLLKEVQDMVGVKHDRSLNEMIKVFLTLRRKHVHFIKMSRLKMHLQLPC